MDICTLYIFSYSKDISEEYKSLGERWVSEVLAAAALQVSVNLTPQNIFQFLLGPAC